MANYLYIYHKYLPIYNGYTAVSDGFPYSRKSWHSRKYCDELSLFVGKYVTIFFPLQGVNAVFPNVILNN